MTDAGGTFVISWDQTETDGQPAAGPSALALGAIWRWDGPVTRIGGGPGPLLLGAREDQDRLRAVVARKAGRMLRGMIGAGPELVEDPVDGLDMAPANGFLVSDGQGAWRVQLLGPAAEGEPPPLVFDGMLPPRATDLWIIDLRLQRADPQPAGQAPGIGAEVAVATPQGPRPAGDLRPGDFVLTRDAGVQPILWTGHHNLSAARLTACPAERPVDLLAGAAGTGARTDLRIGPGQGMALGGAAVADLFGEAAVLVRGADLGGRGGVLRAHPGTGVTLCWLLLPERHLITVAGGAAVESFDPGAVALCDRARAAIAALVPDAFHAESRASAFPGLRRLSAGEAALLTHAPARHLMPAAAAGAARVGVLVGARA